MQNDTHDETGGRGYHPLLREDVDPKLLNVITAVLELFPNLPVSVSRILSMIHDPKTSSREISDIASSDPVLVSTILKKVNSSFYNPERKIDNLNLAVVILGFNEVKHIALQCGLVKTLRAEDNPEINTRDLWVHSYAVSVTSEAMVHEHGHRRSGTLMTVGMLHDIGKFALYSIGVHAKRLGLKARGAFTPGERLTLLEKEERIFGVNHAIVGGMLARKWNLSDRIASVLEMHHLPGFFEADTIPLEFREDVAVTCVADYIVNTALGSTVPQEPLEWCLSSAGVPSIEGALTPAIEAKIGRAMEFLDGLA